MEAIKSILKGAGIGMANVIPGVSGGTIAFVLGVYDKLTEAIGEFITAKKEKKIEYAKFLIQIGFGVILGILVFAKVIEFLYKNYSEATNFFFIGLVVASIPMIIKDERKNLNKRSIFQFLIGVAIVLIFSIFNHFSGEKSSIINISSNLTLTYSFKLFLCGLLAAGTMVVPGVSGSLLLLMLGEYYNVLSFINNRNLLAIAIIGLGAVSGILIFAKVIGYLLRTRRTQTMFLILGLVVASLIEIYPGVTISLFDIMRDAVTFILGFILVYLVKNLDKREVGGN